MKIKQSLIALLAMFAIVSCSKDDDGGVNPDELEGGKTKAVITLTVGDGNSGVDSKATFPSDAPTADEKKINNIIYFAFNNQLVLEDFSFQSLMSTNNEVIVSGDSYTYEMTLTAGAKYFVAVANVPSSYYNYFENRENLLLRELIEEVLPFDLKTLTGHADSEVTRGFFMTSLEKDLTPVYLKEMSDLTDAINRVTIEIGRAVSKVAYAFEPKNQYYGKLTDTEYKMANNPNRMYFMPKYMDNMLLTPNYSDNSVAAGHYQAPLVEEFVTIAPNNHTYIMENSNKTPKEGNTAMAVIKGIFTPDEVLVLNNGDIELDDNGKAKSKAGVYKQDFWRIQAVGTDGLTYFLDGYYDSEPNTVTGQTAVQYPGGVCYYPLWLKNEAAVGQNESKYTVKRNSYYKVTITSVTGAGSPNPDGGIDPEEPLDKETLLGFTVAVKDWSGIEYNEGI